MPTPDPAVVTELQRKFSGLDEQANYIAGSRIHDKYTNYKAADKTAGKASTEYKTTASKLKQKPPGPSDNPVSGPVRNAYFDLAGHQTLKPLAATASFTSKFHADRRDSFNNKYKEVLEAKMEYKQHVQAANAAHNSSNTFQKYQETHHKHIQKLQKSDG
ncbi:hypothetical protein EsH8_II_000332 [Colletotrichum jinshuiense]